MQVPSILQGESLSRLMQGAAAGVVASIVIGFYWGGWMTGSTANRLAAERADTAVVAALMPVCRRVAGRHSRGLPPPTITWLGHVQRS
jgi:hypothetical protein